MNSIATCLLFIPAVILGAPTEFGSRKQVPVAWNTPAGIFRYLLQGVLFDGYQPEGNLKAAIPWYYNSVAGDLTLRNVEISFGRLNLTHDNETGSQRNHSLQVAATISAKYDYPWRAVADEECHRTGELHSTGDLALEANNFALNFYETGNNETTQSRLGVKGFKAVVASNRILRISGLRSDTPSTVHNLVLELLRGVLAEALDAKVADAVKLYNWAA